VREVRSSQSVELATPALAFEVDEVYAGIELSDS